MGSGKLQFLKLADRDCHSYNCTLAPLTVVFVVLAAVKQCLECNPQVMNTNIKRNEVTYIVLVCIFVH